MNNITNNEALYEYFYAVQEGINSLILCSKVHIGGKFGIDGSTDVSEALAIAGEVIPEVGIVLKALAGSINIKNE